jgi:hypothetical protein
VLHTLSRSPDCNTWRQRETATLAVIARPRSGRGRHREAARRSWPSSRDRVAVVTLPSARGRAAVVAIQAGPPVPGLLRPLGARNDGKPAGGEVRARVGMAAGRSSRLARYCRHRETAQRSWPSSRGRVAVVTLPSSRDRVAVVTLPSARGRAAVVAIQTGPPVPGLLRPLGARNDGKPAGGEVRAGVGMAAGRSSRLARYCRHREAAQRSWPSSRGRAAVSWPSSRDAQRSRRSRPSRSPGLLRACGRSQ